MKKKPKLLFWINGFLLHFLLAYYLKSKLDAEFYGLIDINSKPKKFFQEQNLLNFKKSWYYFDNVIPNSDYIDIEYLSKFEEKYQINLWKLAINERIFYRFNRFYKFKTNEILSILEQECKLFEKILDNVNPDFFLTYEPPLHHSKLFYDLCVKKGVKVLGMHIPRVGGKSIICSNSETFDFPSNLNGIDSKNRSFMELRKYRESFNYTKTMNTYISRRGTQFSDKIKALTDYIYNSDSNNTKTNYYYFGRKKSKVVFDAINFLIRKKIRESFIENNLEKNVDLNQKFIYFPLSLDEEFNLLHNAPFYTNQIEIIRHVAKSLPVGYTLYVKEHPGEVIRGWRKISDYKQILEIPNVHLIHPSFSSEKLLETCSLVFTIRSTSSFDAAFFGKPAITLGDVPYSLIPSIHHLEKINDLPNLIKSSLTETLSPEFLDKYLVLIEKNSFDFNMLEFENKRNNFFFSGGILSDVDIPISKMKKFIEENEQTFNQLANEYIKKMGL